jgi:integrase
MPYEQVPAFFAGLTAAPETIGRLALQFTILTAARSGEVRGAVWSEFDLEHETWTIPAERMKAGEEHTVPLSSAAMELMQRLSRACSGPVVFPGLKGQPLSDATLSKILRQAGVPYTVHGFRSSFRDWVAENMIVPGEVAEAALAHPVTNKVEAAYRRTIFLQQRKFLMEEWQMFVSGQASEES